MSEQRLFTLYVHPEVAEYLRGQGIECVEEIQPLRQGCLSDVPCTEDGYLAALNAARAAADRETQLPAGIQAALFWDRLDREVTRPFVDVMWRSLRDQGVGV